MTITLGGIAMPQDLIWVDEYKWSPVSQSIEKSLTGALIVQESLQLKGRKITLSGDDGSAWATKSTLDQLAGLAAQPNTTFTLLHNGTAYNVMFDRSATGGGVNAEGIYMLADPDGDHIYKLTINLIEI